MPSVIGKRILNTSSKCLVSNVRSSKNNGMKLASSDSAPPCEGDVMHSVVSISVVSKPATSYVRCPSCQAKVQKVHGFVSRMSWDRFRCKCGYDGPLEYTAAEYCGRKLRNA
jgi:predicted RNA-binding Zn-ribbon protein involved in translation (DUF1610 family)